MEDFLKFIEGKKVRTPRGIELFELKPYHKTLFEAYESNTEKNIIYETNKDIMVNTFNVFYSLWKISHTKSKIIFLHPHIHRRTLAANKAMNIVHENAMLDNPSSSNRIEISGDVLFCYESQELKGKNIDFLFIDEAYFRKDLLGVITICIPALYPNGKIIMYSKHVENGTSEFDRYLSKAKNENAIIEPIPLYKFIDLNNISEEETW